LEILRKLILLIANFWSGEDLEDPAIVGPNADPDGDGIENVLEFVCKRHKIGHLPGGGATR
tara:strand:- start:2157 stop:2339 length:183 start_codon:yes stop_codon:yes gene_type:complete